jgi:hypothetical protein
MSQTISTARAREAATRLATHRRARRGLVAAYIHELSARHAERPQRPATPPLAEPRPEPAR